MLSISEIINEKVIYVYYFNGKYGYVLEYILISVTLMIYIGINIFSFISFFFALIKFFINVFLSAAAVDLS